MDGSCSCSASSVHSMSGSPPWRRATGTHSRRHTIPRTPLQKLTCSLHAAPSTAAAGRQPQNGARMHVAASPESTNYLVCTPRHSADHSEDAKGLHSAPAALLLHGK